MRLMILLAIGLLSAFPALRAEDKPDPQANLKKLLDRVIELHEKQDYSAYFKECVSPKEMEALLKKRRDSETEAQFLTRVYSGKAPAGYFTNLIELWKLNRSTVPTLSDDQTVATYPNQKKSLSNVESMESKLVFVKEGSQWFVSQQKSRTELILTPAEKKSSKQ